MAIIYFKMLHIWLIVLDSWTITIKNVTLQEKMHPEKIQLDKIQNGWLSAIIYLYMPYILYGKQS